MKALIILYCSVSIMLLYGCASNGFLMAKPKVILYGKTYPAKDEGTAIEVFVTSNPILEYIDIAKITCADTDEKWCLDQISKEARKIGADAIIISGNVGSYGVGYPIGSMAIGASEVYGITAIAIKYNQN